MWNRKNAFYALLPLLLLASSDGLWAQRSPQRCVGQDDPRPYAVVRPTGEAGDPLSLSGVVRDGSGRPIAGARVQIFHTDAEGYYSEGSMEEDNPRLCGVAVTDSDGSYRFETINPARYATGGGGLPHIHYSVWVDGAPPRRFLLQLPDPPPTEIESAERASDGDRTARRRPLVRVESGELNAVRDLVVE